MKKLFSKMDIPLFILTLIYAGLGLVMIYSSSSVAAVVRYGYEPYHFFVRQAMFVLVSLFIGIFIVMKVPTSVYNKLAYPLIFLLLGSLVGLFAYGQITNNALSWFDLKYFKIQPSEFAKSILIIFSAVYYKYLNQEKNANFYNHLVPLGIGLIVVVLVGLQPDLGSAAIIAGIVGMMFISIPKVQQNGSKLIRVILIGGLIAVVGFSFFGDKLLNTMQINRFNYKNPCSRYTEETGYQVCNGFIAINNGGIGGAGLYKSTQKYLYLPESHTDFIFPIIVEELGLVTGIAVILGYIYMLWRMLKIAKSSENLRCSVLAYGTFCYFAFHILVNLLGVLALMPLTGVPLPLLSYGGSFTVNAIIMLFVVQRVTIENKIAKTRREIRSL